MPDEEFDPVRFGANVLSMMEQRGLTCRSAAEETGVSHATINRVTRGNMPDVPTYLRLMKWLGSRRPAALSTEAGSGEGVDHPLFLRACEVVRHAPTCPGLGRWDDDCTCDAVAFLDQLKSAIAEAGKPAPSEQFAENAKNPSPMAELQALGQEFEKVMEPLGAEMEAIWDANRDELYEGAAHPAPSDNQKLREALEPFALDIRPEVPDDFVIETVAWTAGQHRAARAALGLSVAGGEKA